MSVVLCPWHLSQLLRVREVALVAEAHGDAVEAVGFHVAGDEARLERLVLVRNLLV